MLESASPALRAAALWTGLNLTLMLALGLNIVRMRMAGNVPVGTGGDPELERAVRAHGNNTEYVPGLLIAFFGLALLGHPAGQIHIMGGALFVARILHAHGIQIISDGLPPTRATGNVTTWSIYLWACGALVWRALS